MMKNLPVRPPSWLPQPYTGAPLLISKPDAARLLGVGRAQVHGLIVDGHLQVVDIDGLERITMRSILAYVDTLTMTNKRPAATATAGESDSDDDHNDGSHAADQQQEACRYARSSYPK